MPLKTVFAGDEHIVDKQANIFDTIITSSNLSAILQEAESLAITDQDAIICGIPILLEKAFLVLCTFYILPPGARSSNLQEKKGNFVIRPIYHPM